MINEALLKCWLHEGKLLLLLQPTNQLCRQKAHASSAHKIGNSSRNARTGCGWNLQVADGAIIAMMSRDEKVNRPISCRAQLITYRLIADQYLRMSVQALDHAPDTGNNSFSHELLSRRRGHVLIEIFYFLV